MTSVARALTSPTRTAWFVTVAVVITAVVMLTSPFERFTPGDLSRIRAAESRFTAACSGRGDERAASQSLSVLLGYLRRDPDQPLPLHGATGAATMRAEASALLEATGGGPCSHMQQLRDRLAAAVSSK
jgi:hypothetical protein